VTPSLYIYMYTYIHIYTLPVWRHKHAKVYICICIYICIYVCMYTYKHYHHQGTWIVLLYLYLLLFVRRLFLLMSFWLVWIHCVEIRFSDTLVVIFLSKNHLQRSGMPIIIVFTIVYLIHASLSKVRSVYYTYIHIENTFCYTPCYNPSK
jgi:hypothetical protein